ncbi:kinetochore component CENP-S-domain-containing protein [Cercophora newfieldiana]|uniref:Kinetochore component CENP-S-domain-containing protein n=1 Tax=Cercophora newfieldiana TaxID=92897 RepID=A0AA39YGD8_9PEZI|nr:kinetochore component CENP-S-domain-containing protein [Cercophora newfieldiana]
MANVSDDERRDRLKSALWFSVGKIVDEESMRRNMNATPQFIAALTEMLWTQLENIAIDLESFSNHAGRTNVSTDDVLLLARRNDDLHAMIKDAIDKQKAQKQNKRKR